MLKLKVSERETMVKVIKSMKQRAFTLIELVIVIIIIGVLASIGTAQFADLKTKAQTAAENATEANVKSALAIKIGDLEDFPDVTGLAAQVQGGTAVATGVQVTVGSQTCIVLTFTDTACSSATAAVGNTVRCVQGKSCS